MDTAVLAAKPKIDASQLRGAAAIRAIFDADFYLRANPDVGAAGVDPLRHYLDIGWAEGRNPNALFDSDFYLDSNADVFEAGLNPLVHYVSNGAREGRNPHPLFDTRFYTETYPDLGEANPLAHYLHIGAGEHRAPNLLFDAPFYARMHPEAAANPLAHYAEHGLARQLSPHPLFDGAYYLAQHPDVAAAKMNPLAHYLLRGHLEVRNPHPLFDSQWYAARNPDIAEAKVSPLAHYVRHGARLGASPHPLFDTAWYLEQYKAEVGEADALVHYITSGAAALRQPNPLFDAAWYVRQHPEAAQNPLAHYAEHGLARRLSPHPLFDGAFYLDKYPDVAAANMNPLTHYLLRGAEEVRDPNAEFDADTYLRANASKNETPLAHFLRNNIRPAVKHATRRGDHGNAEIIAKIRASCRAASASPVVTVVIPVYQQLPFTLRCVLSILQSNDTTPFEILVVDDCSPDGSGEEIERAFSGLPSIRVHRNPKNLGFLRTCNSAAATLSTQFVYFLNNDTTVLDGWLDELFATFQAHPNAGLVGSKLLYPDGSLQEAGGIVWSDASGANFGRGQDPGKPEFNYLRDADYISGASIMTPLRVWRQLGGFSIEFAPAYYEDTDFAMKVRAAGLRVLYQPLSRVVHHEGISSGTDISSGVKRYQEVNKSTFLAKWQGVLSKHGKNADFRKSIVDRTALGRILIFDAETPTPDKDSGSVTAFNYMRILSKLGYRVTFVPQNLLWCGPYSTALQRMGVEVIHRPYATNSRDYLLSQAHEHDLIILSRAPNGGKLIDEVRAAYPGKPIIFDTVDLHHLRVQRQYELEQKPELLEQANELKEVELNAIRKADHTILVSDYEVAYLEQQIGPFPHTVIPLIYDDYKPRNGYDSRRDFIFVGGYRHPPNVDAVNYLINEIWPCFRRYNTGAKLHIVGSHMPKEFEALACDDIIVTGFVADLEAYMENIRVSLAPLRYGAGVKGKVGNSLRMGVPVVATPIAAEGMGLLDGEHILVGSNANEFAKKMLDVYSEREVWRKFSHRGQKQVCESYGLAAAEDRLTGLIIKLFKMSS